jgi:hypothetical protein
MNFNSRVLTLQGIGYVMALTLPGLPLPAQASLSVGVDTSVANWKGDVGNRSFDDDGNVIAVGANIKIKFYKLFTGLDYLTGKYHFDNQPAPGSIVADGSKAVTRTELNAVVGYYLFDNLSLFAKYKSLKFDATHSYHFKNPGIGSQVHWTVTRRWLLFANVAFFKGDVHLDGNNSGDSSVREYAIGVAFRPTLHTHFILSSRHQELDIDMKNSQSETHDYSGWFLSYNYIF